MRIPHSAPGPGISLHVHLEPVKTQLVPELLTAPQCFGRDAELRRLTDLVRQAAAGHGAAAVLAGGPGIGQTPLLGRGVAAGARQRVRGVPGRPEGVGRPLADTAVAGLVAHRLGAPPGPALRELVAGASGNPMYVGELLDALGREDAVRLVDGMAEVVRGTGWQVPRSLVEAIQQRLAFLPRVVRRTLEIAAVLGETLDVNELSTILDTPVVVLSAVVDEAMAAGLLADEGGLLAFRHELIREALAQHQPASVRAALQLRAGRVLAAAGAPVEGVAGHLAAGSLLDRDTVDWL